MLSKYRMLEKNQMMYDVSVVIPVFNRSNLLKIAIDSVMKQKTTFNVETIVVDDYSTEDISAVCRNYTCRYILNNIKKGANHARNLGVKEAKGRIIAFLDSDDFFITNNVLQLQAGIMTKNLDIVMVYPDKWEVFCEGNSIVLKNANTEPDIHMISDTQKKLLRVDFIGSYSGVMVKKSAFESIGGCDVTLPARQDWDLWLRMSRLGSVAHCKEPLIGYRCHPDQISKSPENKIIGTLAILNKHYELFSLSLVTDFWKQIHCIKIILAASLCLIDLQGYDISRLRLITQYLKKKKSIDYVIQNKISRKFLKICCNRSYFFRGVFN
jgi:glycosyltransferase involved in cell wall biosynthesis